MEEAIWGGCCAYVHTDDGGAKWGVGRGGEGLGRSGTMVGAGPTQWAQRKHAGVLG